MKRSTKNIIKWALYVSMLLLLFALQSTPDLFELGGVKPAYLVPLVVFVAVFEGEVGGLAFSIAAGLIWDLSSDKLLGFSAILLGACCVATALLTIFFVRATMLNCCVLSAVTMLIYILFDYLLMYAVWGYGGTLSILFGKLLPMAAYTIAVSPLIFLAVRKIASKYNEIIRV